MAPERQWERDAVEVEQCWEQIVTVRAQVTYIKAYITVYGLREEEADWRAPHLAEATAAGRDEWVYTKVASAQSLTGGCADW